MSQNFGDVVRPLSGDLRELTRSTELLHVLARLGRSGFTGLVYAEHDADSLVISVRNGTPVFVEELGEATSIPDMLLERGVVTKEQYADITARVLESMAENEDLAFCEHAVELGFATRAQIDAELERRMRGKLIQAVSWEECRIEIDGDPDGVTGILELPQHLGSIIYVGVRTFFDDDRVRAALHTDQPRYVRLLRPPSEVIEFFQLEGEDTALLAQLSPDENVSDTIERAAADPLEAWQLLCMLRLADMAEFGNAPFAPSAERSGVRATQTRMPIAREEPSRNASQARIPVPREDGPRSPSQGRFPGVAREEVGRRGGETRTPGVREERVVMPGSLPRFPAVGDPVSRASQARMPAVDPAAAARAPESARSPAAPRPRVHSGHLPPQAAAPASSPVRGPESPPSAQAAAQPRAPQSGTEPLGMRKRPPRKLSQALQRLDRELKQIRAPSAPTEASDEPAPNYGRAHLEHLMRMRSAAAQKSSQGAAPGPANEDFFQKAQEALRDHHFGRAYEFMRKACEAQPNNEIYTMYALWAALRSNNLPEDGIQKLRALLRERVSDDQYQGFAYYALGHLSLYEKKDEAAEKFFRKATELDKNNKDAERHLRIIELRRKTAAAEGRANKIFGIEIGAKKSS